MTVSDPQTPGAVTGYQPQRTEKIDAVNQTKALENELGLWVQRLRSGSIEGVEIDQRWASIAVTELQLGFMALNRAVFQPESELSP